MNLLVIGNGFDLALGLPTSYIDFLDFAQAFHGIFPTEEFAEGNLDRNRIINSVNTSGERWEEYERRIINRTVDKIDIIEKCINRQKDIFNKLYDVFSQEKITKVVMDFHSCIHYNRWNMYFRDQYIHGLITGKNGLTLKNLYKKL